jgi:DNA ligase D-like protein (predicted 3'-phosphoesterase)
MPHFVIQEHQCRTHHFDVGLEKDGVFKSWAVPKGFPAEPGVKRLGAQAEDHYLSFGDFEGQHSAGQVHACDSGTYALSKWNSDLMVFSLHGAKSSGDFYLIGSHRGSPRIWPLFETSESKAVIPTKPKAP